MSYSPDQQGLYQITISPELHKHWKDNRQPEDRALEDTIRRLEGLPPREWICRNRRVYG